MKKIALTLGLLFGGFQTWAGALPYEWHACTAQRVAEDGTVLKFSGAGMSEQEASENALYRCNFGLSEDTCQVTNCSWQTVRPRKP